MDYHLSQLQGLPTSEQLAYLWQGVKRRSGRVAAHHDWGLEVPESEPQLQAILSANR